MYCRGLGLRVLGRFEDHDGFDGVLLGLPGADYHFELTVCRTHPVAPAPTPEDLVVLYIPDAAEWDRACADMLAAGFKRVTSFNPYWEANGRTYEDDDGYRVVLQNASWAEGYRIRQARPIELARLREIEDEAGTIFSGLGLIDEARDVSFPPDDLARLVGLGQVWVACPSDDVPVGFVIASVREGVAYVEEMDVLPAHGRRGLGARLLEQVCAWARAQGHAAVTLSTFREVPWNGPFYRKHGFRELPPAEWTPGLRAIREREARHGLRVEARVFMRRDLGEIR